MHYRIVYARQKHRIPRLSKRQKMIAGTAVVSLLLIAVFLAFGTQWLLPGDPEVSATALENMVSSVKNGESLSDAVVAFCQEIVANAQMP